MIINSDVYNGILKMYDDFEGDDICFIYESSQKYYNIINNYIDLKDICGNGSSYNKSVNLMKWLYSILLHNPNYANNSNDNTITLLNNIKNKRGINCRATATILTECLLSMGIPARNVWLLPFNPYDTDCHVVNMAYCDDIKKWIILDATVNTVIMNEEGIPLDPIETRNLLKNRKKLLFSKDLRYYRINCSFDNQTRGYYSYLSKNMFFFKTNKINCFGLEGRKSDEYIYYIPQGFDYAKQRLIIENKPNNIDLPIICSTDSFVNPNIIWN